MVLKIIKSGDERLRKVSLPVKKIDKKVKTFIADLQETLLAQKDPEGVGLAAPQVGKNLQIFLASYQKKNWVIINPKILSVSKQPVEKKTKKEKKRQILEGCLSLPHYYGPLTRSKNIKLEYLDENGNKKVEEFKGFMAQIIQHEIDHLNGILFVDRILEYKKPLYQMVNGEWEEVELV